jgi:hypothetical protein
LQTFIARLIEPLPGLDRAEILHDRRQQQVAFTVNRKIYQIGSLLRWLGRRDCHRATA